MDDYEWVTGFFQRRCGARLNEKFLIYKGRCDLKRNHNGPHALDRGMEVVEFKTSHEVKLTKLARLVVEQEIRKREGESSP